MITEQIVLKREQVRRSVVKSLSWRCLGTLDTILISYIVTQKLDFAVSIGAVELVTKMALYIGHERLWDKITWGRTND